jgi:pimeloyl-ACP methyl ester carboxylesterase
MATFALLPGLDGTGDLFRPLLEVIPPGLSTRVVAYPVDRALSYSDLLRVVEAQLEDEADVVLVAESFSGPLAIRYAAAHPERVRAVVLCASFVRSPVPRWLRVFCTPLAFRFPPPAAALRWFMVGRGASASLVASVRAAIARVSPRVLVGRVREVINVDCVAALRECRAPVLYLAAMGDALVGRSAVATILAARRDVQVRRVEGPHLLLQREPRRAWREVEGFLSQLASAGG